MDTSVIPLVAFILTAVGWLSRELWRYRAAKRQAAHDAGKILSDKKKLLEDMISKTQDTGSKQTLLAQLDEVNAALLGLYAKRLRHTLEDAGLPAEEELIANGRSRLRPQEVNRLRETIAEINALPPFLSIEVLRVLGNAYYYIEQYRDAKNIYNKIIDLNPYNHVAIRHRGAVYIHMKKYEDAIADFNRSLELKPDEPIALHDRGVAFTKLKKYKEALNDFSRALELKPNHYIILDNRGATYGEIERYDEALADLNRSLEVRPDEPHTLCDRGIIYAKLERYDEAIADYNRALELEPDDPSPIYNLACLFSLRGKTSKALSYLGKAIRKDKKYREKAKTDKDFDNIRDDPRFKKLIEPD